LLQQPDAGVVPLVHGIDAAKSSVEILIFRFDQREIERALANAVSRGVAVKALIAHINGSGGESLRRLELRLLEAGVTVARTDDGLARYHAKLMIVDRRELYLLAFNFTNQDINRSRSFGVVTQDKQLVREAVKLFEADMTRQSYEPSVPEFVVSPENARKQLGSFIEGAKRDLLIYDPKISDKTMIRLLQKRSAENVNVRIIGQVSASEKLQVRTLSQIRLHTRAMVCDGKLAFVGSQSLREIELDRRREVGLIFGDSVTVNQIAKTFEEDWDAAEPGKTVAPPAKVAKKVAKAISKELPAITPVLEGAIKKMGGDGAQLDLDTEEVEQAVRDAVKDAVKEAVEDVVTEAGQNARVKA
jgi:phosphatidylserine/phosphatidylglycerophosphate/cardiolipin synthase-like enzyme